MGELSLSRRDPYLDDEDGLSRTSIFIGAVTFGLVGLMVYNLGWRQPQLAMQRAALGASGPTIEIDANGAALSPSNPATRAQVDVEGSNLPEPAALKADPLIAAIQTELTALGLYEGAANGLPTQNLREAIANWQRKAGIAITGAANPELLERLAFERQIRDAQNFDVAMVSEPKGPTQTIIAKQDGQVIGGNNDVDLRQIQLGLADLGYRPGPIDGQWREQLAQAIRQFEQDRGLSITGQPSLGLLAELGDYVGAPSAQLQ